jgi:dihydroorotate dehydrogenase electron transfer subunit
MVEEIVSLDRNEQIGKDIWRMEFRSPPLAPPAKPGQFLMIHLGNRTKDPLLRRPFSIHGILDDHKVMVLYRIVGAGTSLLSTLKQGDSISAIGPLGNSFPLPAQGEEALLVAGGMGIAPLYFLAQALQRDPGHTTTVLLGFSSSREVVCSDELKDLGVHLSLATEDGSQGRKGLVTDLLDQHLSHGLAAKPIIYACGPPPMLKKVAQQAAMSHLRCSVCLEGHMACGLGICLGCAVKASHNMATVYHYVCQDGPVFPAETIDWETV